MMHSKTKARIIAIIGGIFTVYGLILCMLSNLDLGVVLVLAFGLVTLCTGVFYPQIEVLKIFKICRFLFIFILCAAVVLVSFLTIYSGYDTVNYNEDAILVLGAGIRGEQVTLPLKLRLDKAIEYHCKNPKAILVVTGGQGFQETVTEAYAMEKYLLQNGVDKTKILREDKATSTAENMQFSKDILDAHLAQDYSVAVVTNNFHVFRAVTIAKKAGFQNVSHLHAGLQWYNLLPCFLRESLAVIKMAILE